MGYLINKWKAKVKEEKEYKRKKDSFIGGSSKKEGKLKELHVTKNSEYMYKSEIYIHKNIPSSNLTEERFSLQILLLNHSNPKPTHYDSHLTH